ncbi:MAG: hypothetical protein Q4D89_11730 [Arachnia propionica]|uniref:hypothetical protein n=1 Tax=Arachnia propionica TaxID=1750 RepID=UPI0026F9D1AF|nr:hypothetical protein [Arachnia propionica]
MTMMRCWRPVVAVVVAVCLLVAGCVSEWDRRMQGLRDDPMASASWEGLELLGTVETSNDSWNPPSPSITRCYKLTVPVEEAFSQVKSTAEQCEWSKELIPSAVEYASYEKVISGSKVFLQLSTSSVECDVSYPNFDFRITLTDR